MGGALATRDDLAGRLAIAPLVLEARGLDVTPQLIEKVVSVGDDTSADILDIIMKDEVGHVATGKHWFDLYVDASAVTLSAVGRALSGDISKVT